MAYQMQTSAPELMERAGMDWRAILASLTTAPAGRFGQAGEQVGEVAVVIALGRDAFVYLEEVDRADIYLGIFGYEYGFEDAEGISPTEREYDRARARDEDADPLLPCSALAQHDTGERGNEDGLHRHEYNGAGDRRIPK